MEGLENKISRDTASYYDLKLAKYGMTPQGVDWNGLESQTLRFQQLCEVINMGSEPFSANDLGCGYGALFDYVRERFHQLAHYTGVDVSRAMVAAAEARVPSDARSRFIVGSAPDRIADYGFASGIFNVRLEYSDLDWLAHIQDTLALLDRTSRIGFSFNCLSKYSDAPKQRAYLYYADPCQVFDFCKRRFSKYVTLLHDYPLYEFTILVRK
jgi:SAM-dependent methyltransferase